MVKMVVSQILKNETENVNSRTLILTRRDEENETDARVGLKLTETDSRKIHNLFGFDLALGDELVVKLKVDNSQTKFPTTEDLKPNGTKEPTEVPKNTTGRGRGRLKK